MGNCVMQETCSPMRRNDGEPLIHPGTLALPGAGKGPGLVLAPSPSLWVPGATPRAVPGSSSCRAGGDPAVCHRPARRLRR